MKALGTATDALCHHYVNFVKTEGRLAVLPIDAATQTQTTAENMTVTQKMLPTKMVGYAYSYVGYNEGDIFRWSEYEYDASGNLIEERDLYRDLYGMMR